jgi:hypothetical protein
MLWPLGKVQYHDILHKDKQFHNYKYNFGLNHKLFGKDHHP